VASPGSALAGSTCLVTGGYGFIGANLVHRLVASGARVRVLDALVPSHGGDPRNLAGAGDIEVLEARLGDPRAADLVAGCDLIFNVAGQVSHTASMSDPVTDLELNALDHARFLEIVRAVNPGARIVHTSTRQVYGRAERLPADETVAAFPVDVNGVAKWAGEKLHMVYSQALGIRSTSLRLSNTYGPRQRLTSDELGVLPVFVRKALRGETIEIFGDGSQRRDCLHVDDVVDALLVATDDRAVGRFYNVGHHTDHSLAEIAMTMVDAARAAGGAGSDVRLVPWPAAHARVDIGSFTTDSSRIADELGWKAQIPLADGVRATFEFYREHPGYLA
jgi:UDP-glucose 4-epimerase